MSTLQEAAVSALQSPAQTASTHIHLLHACLHGGQLVSNVIDWVPAHMPHVAGPSTSKQHLERPAERQHPMQVMTNVALTMNLNTNGRN
jgi:hypothetical protein